MNFFDRLSARFKKIFLISSATGVFLVSGVEAPLIWKNEQNQKMEYAKNHERAGELEKANGFLLKAQEIHQQDQSEALHYINEAQALLSINADAGQVSYYDKAFKKINQFPLDEDQIDSMRTFTIEAIRKLRGYEAAELVSLRRIKPSELIIDTPWKNFPGSIKGDKK